jgi:hypothetical protein
MTVFLNIVLCYIVKDNVNGEERNRRLILGGGLMKGGGVYSEVYGTPLPDPHISRMKNVEK